MQVISGLDDIAAISRIPHVDLGITAGVDFDSEDNSDDKSDDSSDSSSGRRANYLEKVNSRCNCKLVLSVALSSLLSLEGNLAVEGESIRCGNKHRDRRVILEWARGLDATMFQRQFRICREDFQSIVLKIADASPVNRQQAINSSGSEINAELCLMVTLRILAGASYLDMIHYHVHVDSVSSIVWRTCKVLYRTLDNIKIATNAEDIHRVTQDWAEQQFRRWGVYLTVGTLYAGDGLAIEIQQPSAADLRGRSLLSFRNRKGFWALIAQGFCEVTTRFAVFDINWPGNTNDIVAYPMTEMYRLASEGYFPAWCTLVLDEAYCACGGIHLTPFSIHQLKRAKAFNSILYYKMLAFNNVLSSQRITIERAFGILIRRWGILWKPIMFSLRKVATIVKVCAMLHNVCVDRWVSNGKPRNRRNDLLPDVPDQVSVQYAMPSDTAIMEHLRNDYTLAHQGSAHQPLRDRLMEDIYSAGIRSHTDVEYMQL